MLGKRRSTKRTVGRRCVADGCARSVRPGRVLCPAHARGAYGRELEAAIGRMARQVEQAFTAAPEPGVVVAAAPDRRDEAVATFERRVARGEYGELFDARLREVMAQAAAERGIAEEIGALRVVLARLMTDPGIDPLQLAHGVARVAGTTVRAMRMQQELEAGVAAEFQHNYAQLADELLTERQRLWERQRAREAAEREGDEELMLRLERESRAAMFPAERE
ncbi:MAG: hypothetical protein M3464_08805 [Chloroflexota bacterium]|nr:hypothetical protein [Chloroflexota bacterium]